MGVLRRMLRRSVPTDHDRLLDAAHDARPTRPAAGSADPLADLLRAAAAPARERELAGEEAAVAAFRAARRPATAASATRPRRHRFTAGAVAWIAGLAATATAGAALAAVGLDRSGPSTPPPAVTSPAAPPSDPGDGTHNREPSAAPTAAPTGDPTGDASATSVPGTPSPGASAEPDPEATVGTGPGNSTNTSDHRGLCRAYLAKSERQRERALRTPAFHELVVAAGGAEQVEEYCRGQLADSDADPTPSPAG